ncbi:MAG TPA: FIST N-terminal domain-containing protein [Burkholderiaceae bacterium]|nr:FIST N-terminal domain-containing protein [Burkholderiaceae bacterium]
MPPFLCAHATDADWQVALRQVAGQIERMQRARRRDRAVDHDAPTLGFVYLTDRYAPHAQALHSALHACWPDVAWVGAVGVGISATGIEYIGVPALALMLTSISRESFSVFSGIHPLSGFDAHTALVHADPATPDLAELISEMSERTSTGYLFGGLASSQEGPRLHIADGVFEGGLSGVAFGEDVALLSRVTQGCQPVGPTRRVTAADRNLVLTLDDMSALDALLVDIGVDLQRPQQALPRLRATLVGLSEAEAPQHLPSGSFGTETRVRHLIGLDPGREAIAIADEVQPGMHLTFCARHAQAARRDVVRICSEIREELEPQEIAAGDIAPAAPGNARLHSPAGAGERMAGAIYVSCSGRGGPHFGAPSAELQVIRHALGDVPLVGFFASGEIAYRHLYGYTGVLTVFTTD